ncbi:MAG: hypothetical protein M0Z87_12270 [Actinomycetota bacterium]|nr:hypothetical protein [Actinomycetota bacterium]
MRIVVVGGTGNVGTAVLDALSSDDRVSAVTALARRLPTRCWPRTEVRSADMSRGDLRPHFEGAQVVIHLGWLFL